MVAFEKVERRIYQMEECVYELKKKKGVSFRKKKKGVSFRKKKKKKASIWIWFGRIQRR